MTPGRSPDLGLPRLSVRASADGLVARIASAERAAEHFAARLDAVADDRAATCGQRGATAWIAHSKELKTWVVPPIESSNAVS